MGVTSALILDCRPRSYCAIERDGAAARVVGEVVRRHAWTGTASSLASKSEDPVPVQVPVVPTAIATAAPAQSDHSLVPTAEERQCFGIIEALVKSRYPSASIANKPAKGYLTIMQKGLWSWFIHLGVKQKPYWVSFRHVKVEDAKVLCPAADVDEGSQHLGASRVRLEAHADVGKLGPLILAAYDAETVREQTGDPAHEEEPALTH